MLTSGQPQVDENNTVAGALNTHCTNTPEMNAVEETESVKSDESKESKPGRGGKRRGAGRKPNYAKRLGLKPMTAAEILSEADEKRIALDLLKHKNANVRLQTLCALWDRRDGKPKQAVNLSGGVVHGHTVYRNPVLAALSMEELDQLDSITQKLALPVADTSTDASQNQIQSKPASIHREVLPPSVAIANGPGR